MKLTTRQSQLARYQANMAKEAFENNGINCEFIFLETSADRNSYPLFAGKGIFIKELQDRLIQGTADIAVHSLKDLPILQIPPLALYALLPRASKEDVLILSPMVVSESGLDKLSEEQCSKLSFEELKDFLFKSECFSIKPFGTSSLRRTLLIKEHFGKTLNCQSIRGNVNSRLKRVQENEYGAIILAKAGLERLNLYSKKYMFTLDPKVFVPSAGQGIIAIEANQSHPNTQDNSFFNVCTKISDEMSCIEAGIERTVLYILGSDCYTPVGVYFDGKNVYLTTEVNSNFVSCKIEFSDNEIEEVFLLLRKHNNFYADFFKELCISSFAKKIQIIFKENNILK